jgi:hypothetical protein
MRTGLVLFGFLLVSLSRSMAQKKQITDQVFDFATGTSRISRFMKPLFADSVQSRAYLTMFLLENSGNFYSRNGQKDTISNMYKAFPVNLLISNEQNPLKKRRFSYYEYDLKDILIAENDSVFVVDFAPIKNSKDSLKGTLKITSDNYALKEVNIRNADICQPLSFYYTKTEEKWYRVKPEVIYNYIYETSLASAGVEVAHLQEFGHTKENFSLEKVYFDGVSRMIDSTAGTISFKSFEKLRFYNLLDDEQLTYERAGLKSRPFLRKRLDLLEWPSKILKQASAPIGPFLLTLDQNLVNFHEFARAGLGIQNNLMQYPRFGFEAAAGYGLKDQEWKYRLSAAWHITRDRYNRLGVYRIKDIRSPGQVNFLAPNLTTPYPQYLYFNRDGYVADRYIRTGAELYTRPLRWTWVRFFGEKQGVDPINYSEISGTSEEKIYYNYGVMMRFARKETFIRNGFFERVRTIYFPVFHLNLSRSDLQAETNHFYTLSLDFTQRIRWKNIGYDIIKLEAGQSWGDIPYNFLFNNIGGGRSFFSLRRKGFVTGNFLNYVSNRYVFTDVAHHFGEHLIKTRSKWFQPQIAVGHRFSWSVLDQKYSFESINLSSFSRQQYEVNLYLRNLVVLQIMGIKAGFGFDFAYNYSPNFEGRKRWAVLPSLVSASF